jgi:hypothetical protein
MLLNSCCILLLAMTASLKQLSRMLYVSMCTLLVKRQFGYTVTCA